MDSPEHRSIFIGLPVRDFSPRGFLLTTESAAFELDESHPLEMPQPCAVRINGQALMSWPSEGLGCCLGPVLGLVASVICWFVLEGFWESVGAGVITCLVVFVPWTIIDERRRRAQLRALLLEMDAEIDELAVLGDNRDEVIRLLTSMRSLSAMAMARLIHSGVAESTPALMVSADEGGENFEPLAEVLIQASPYLPQLKALFVNELTADECEISWIINGDCASLLEQYPHIEHFQIRGGGTRFISVLKLHYLHTLIVESGGLSHEPVEDLTAADLPNLRHLELWTGQEDFGGSCECDHIVRLLESRRWEHLRHLGIRNCEFADEVIEWLVRSPLIEQLESLDFSLGCVSDRGAQQLLDCLAVRELKSLDLHYHYISEPLMQQLRSLPIDINLDDPQESEVGGDGEPLRYSAVGE